MASTVGSFATTEKVRNTNSLAFVDGVPIFERFFLGDEFTIRGYNVRSITPLAPLDTFLTSRNVVVASNAFGTPEAIPGVPAIVGERRNVYRREWRKRRAATSSFTPIGGDTPVARQF